MAQIPDDIKELDKRIADIKKNCLSPVNGNSKHSDFSQATIVLQLAVELVSGTVVGASIGYILDEVFDFKFIFLLIFTIFGGLAGLVNVARYLKKIDESKEDK